MGVNTRENNKRQALRTSQLSNPQPLLTCMPPAPPFFKRKSIFIMKSMVCAGNGRKRVCVRPQAACCAPMEMKNTRTVTGGTQMIRWFPSRDRFLDRCAVKRGKFLRIRIRFVCSCVLPYAYHVCLSCMRRQVRAVAQLSCVVVREYGCFCARQKLALYQQ